MTFAPGTNYDRRMTDRRIAAVGIIAKAAAQDAKCAAGEHDITEARPRYVTWVSGEQIAPGTTYCRRCKKILERAAN